MSLSIYISIAGIIISILALAKTFDIYIKGVSSIYNIIYKADIQGHTMAEFNGTLKETIEYGDRYHPGYRAIVAPITSNVHDIIDRQIKGPGYMPLTESLKSKVYIIIRPQNR